MDTTQASQATKWKVGLFTAGGLLLLALIGVLINGHPYWWRSCQFVRISVNDASGLKSKSPVRSLGLEIGYVKTVDLAETAVDLGICITAPVKVLPTTRAYLQSDGFLGDKYVELKPVLYTGPKEDKGAKAGPQSRADGIWDRLEDGLEPLFWSRAYAATAPVDTSEAQVKGIRGQEIPVGDSQQDMTHLVNRVDQMVNQMSTLTNNLKQAINPQELRSTLHELNSTLQNANKTLSPEGGITQTAQRTMAKLEDAVEQARDLMVRVNKGEGSVGMLLTDPSYADEIRDTIKSANRLLSKFGSVRFVVDIGAEEVPALSGARGMFKLQIWPRADRYYLIGAGVDPRGKLALSTDKTTIGSQSVTVSTEHDGLSDFVMTAMMGKVFWRRIDLSIGVIDGDGAVTAALLCGPHDSENRITLASDVYARSASGGIDARFYAILRPLWTIYLKGGLESIHQTNGQLNYAVGAGLMFEDDDIKMMFAFK